MKLNNRYFLLRHGQATSNLEPRWLASWPEKRISLLTPKGKKEMEKASQFFRKIGLDFIYSSDLKRTAQTAKIIKEATGARIIFEKNLRELNVGIFNGQHPDIYLNFFKNKLERFYKKPPKGENLLDCQKRMLAALKKINGKYRNKNILIVGHGDPLWLLEGGVKNKTPRQMLNMYPKRLMPGEYRELKTE
jgi:broad specificity phosphatase PhoE